MTTRNRLGAVGGPNSTEQPDQVRVCVAHLRKELEPDAENPRHILTEPWVGNLFEPGA